MTKKLERAGRQRKGRVDEAPNEEFDPRDMDDVRFDRKRQPKVLTPKNEIQARYIHAIGDNVVTFATGPAGTGKTYVAGTLAALALQSGAIKKIVLTRPAVEAGENLGFLPGELEEKYQPYIIPFKDVLVETLGKTFYEYCLKTEKIELAPLAFMRGRTFRDCFVILDEAQNVTPVQMKMFLTRIGDNCTAVVNGDLRQKDIEGPSGLADAVNRLENVPKTAWVEFEKQDVVRSGFVQHVIEAYES